MSVIGGWRVALRIARREGRRRKAQTALMLILICLPVLAVTAAAIVWRTQDVSRAEGLDRRMGSAQAVVEASGNAAVDQSLDFEQGGYHPAEGSATTIDPAQVDVPHIVRTSVAADARVVPLTMEAPVTFRTDRGRASAAATATDWTDPLTRGLARHVSGTFPPGPGEVVISQAFADLGPRVGDTVQFSSANDMPGRTQPERDLRVVGIAESSAYEGRPIAFGAAGAFGTPAELGVPGRYLIGPTPITWADQRALNQQGLLVLSRQVLTDPSADAVAYEQQMFPATPADEAVVTVLALVVAMVLLEVVLLAGPAFAVRAKGQAYTLALVAASGGSPRQARRTILASGAVIGVVGAVLGVLLGIGVGTVAVPIAQHFEQSRFGPFQVPWRLLIMIAGFGLLSAVLAAVVPAVSASRQNVVQVLAGRRGEGQASRRTPLIGAILLGIGIGSAAIGTRSDGLVPVLVALSVVVSVVGMIMFVPTAVILIARAGAHLPLALRFAARDAARHRTRTVPAVAAVAATVAGVIALGIAVGSQERASEAGYDQMMGIGQASIGFPEGIKQHEIAVLEKTVRARLPGAALVSVINAVGRGRSASLDLSFRVDGHEVTSGASTSVGTGELVARTIPPQLEVPRGDRARADKVLRAGGVVLLRGQNSRGPAPSKKGDQVRVGGSVYTESADGQGRQTSLPARSFATTSITVDQPWPSAATVFSPQAVHALGLRAAPAGVAITSHVSAAAEQDLNEALAALDSQLYLYVERGYHPDEDVRTLQFVLGVLGAVLMLGGTLSATFLALSDSRPDLATMAAVGARPRARRAVAASYALVVGGLGALLGALVGFIPGVAISRPLTRVGDVGSTTVVIPWLLIGVVVIGLPVLTALVVGACTRSRLPLVTRID
ncbi:MAG: hypothetical protein L0H31_00155 [Nocardioidaceae bacterium]|nr:hypothetical protein [Nocardioidaceae bacterium]